MAGRPTGTVTFLFTDIEGSTRLWEDRPDDMRAALAEHDALLRDVFAAHGGYVFSTGGDGFAVAFGNARDAVEAAVQAQTALAGHPLIKMRMGIHTGEVYERDGDYFGPAVNRAARVMAAGHGGQVLVSQATTELISPRFDLLDLGTHRLRDLGRAEHIHQLGNGEHPALRTLDSFSTNLPLQSTGFIGREHEMEEVRDALMTARLVTLTGVGGVGKTRLALHVAAELLPAFADGVHLIELAALSDASALPEAVAAVLDVPLRPGMDFVESVVDFLRVREMLLVLDNCEHVLAQSARLVDSVLLACPSVRVLATSREGLGVPGEQMRTVPSLPVPPVAASSVEAVNVHAAARLFVERAQRARDGFRLDTSNAGAVTRIVQQLDGIPLAIELAAARVRAMGPSEIADRLDERFRLLTGGSRVALERHQTLRGAVDWSYELMNESDRAVFDRLSVFAGGFTLAAAQAVVADDAITDFDVLDCLTDLVSKSMVAIDDDADGGVRYRMLETLRQYGREKLDQRGESDVVRRRHAEFFTAFAERADAGVRGHDEASWARRVAIEIDNLRVAFRWSVDIGDIDLALQLVVALGFFGWGRESTGVHGWAAEATAVAGADRRVLFPRAGGFAGIGTLNTLADSDLAVAQAERALEIARATGNPPGCWPQITLGSVHILQGRPGEAEAAFVLALEEARRDGTPTDIVNVTVQVFVAVLFQGRSTEAAKGLGDALVDARRLGCPTVTSLCAGVLSLALAPDDPTAALPVAEFCIAEAGKVNNLKSLGCGLQALGLCHDSLGDTRAALQAYRRAIEFADVSGDQIVIAPILERLVPLLASTASHPDVDNSILAISTALDGYFDGRYALSAELTEARRHAVGVVRARVERQNPTADVAPRTFSEVLMIARDAIDRVAPLLEDAAGA
jgi:predicted ATPase/class 3 adenylate cyclase